MIKNVDYGSSISCVAWRPGYASCLATCASLGGVNDYKIHVWDAEREYTRERVELYWARRASAKGLTRQQLAEVLPGPQEAGAQALALLRWLLWARAAGAARAEEAHS